MGTIAEPHFDFSASAAFNEKKLEVAVVLIATAIEQCLNIFYRYVLGADGLLASREITEVIRSTNMSAKTGWLLSLVSGRKMSDELHSRVMNLAELRNQIVHFKAVPSDKLEDSTGGSHNIIRQRIRSLNFKELLALPSDLSKELNETRELVWSRSPNYTLAREIAKSLVAYVQSEHPIKNSLILDFEPGDSRVMLSMSEN